MLPKGFHTEEIILFTFHVMKFDFQNCGHIQLESMDVSFLYTDQDYALFPVHHRCIGYVEQ